jgi:hypothetical protein
MAEAQPINPWCPICSQPLMAPEKVTNPETKEEFTRFPCVNLDGAHYSALNSHLCLDYDHEYTEVKRQQRAEAAQAEADAKLKAEADAEKAAKKAKPAADEKV